MDNSTRTINQQVKQTNAWIREDEDRADVPLISISMGYNVGSETGQSTFTRRIGLLEIPIDKRPEFALGVPVMVDTLLQELRYKLISDIQELATEDHWASAADALATRADSVEDAATLDVAEDSTYEHSPAGSPG